MFTIGSAQIWYNIEVNVNITSENEWGNLSQARESIILSPEEIIKSTSDGTVIAQLIGDFSPFELEVAIFLFSLESGKKRCPLVRNHEGSCAAQCPAECHGRGSGSNLR